jgi:hypothetical protein
MKRLFHTAMAATAMHLLLPLAGAQDPSAALTQTGVGNLAAIEQVAPTADAIAMITQTGVGNIAGGTAEGLAGITQTDSNSVEGRIVQDGRRNVANLGQDEVLITTAAITQAGQDNVAVTRQHDALHSAIEAYQDGRRNSAVLYQDGVFPFLIRTSQRGADNRIFVDERYGGFAGPVVAQDGEGNTATIVQYDDYYSGIGIEQIGLRNSAAITQTAAYMTDGMLVVQHGADNHATVFNTGSYNSLLVSQLGNSAVAASSQNGSGNRGVITQH